jgi:elongation factor G
MEGPLSCRETITKAAEGEGKLIKQSGGTGQYAHVITKIEPNERGKGVEIINKVTGGNIPKEFIEPVKDGLRESMRHGVLAGYPVVDVVVHIVDGSYHEIDSSELAFKLAAIFAIKDAMKKAGPILLDDDGPAAALAPASLKPITPPGRADSKELPDKLNGED